MLLCGNGAVPAPPADGEVKKVADKLALFVAKNGRQFEEVTREKNLGKGPFRCVVVRQVRSCGCKFWMVGSGTCGDGGVGDLGILVHGVDGVWMVGGHVWGG